MKTFGLILKLSICHSTICQYIQDISIGYSGLIAIIRNNSIYTYNPQFYNWTKLPDLDGGFTSIRVGFNDKIFAQSLLNQTYGYKNNNWKSYGLYNIRDDLSSSALFSLNINNSISKLNSTLPSWIKLFSDGYKDFVLSPNGDVYGIHLNNSIFFLNETSSQIINQQTIIPGDIFISSSNTIYVYSISNFYIYRLNDKSPFEWIQIGCLEDRLFIEGTPFSNDIKTGAFILCLLNTKLFL